MKRIEISLVGGVWVAEWFGPERARIEGLFGTAVVPTPFLMPTPWEEVASALRELNPGYEVFPKGWSVVEA